MKDRAKTEDGPKISMRVERGHLIPASAFDLELLSQWREGAILNIEVSLAVVRPLEKKYFAMLTHLLKTTETGWSNVATAHDTLKGATGFVEPQRYKNGKWNPNPPRRHLASLSDTELGEYYELVCGIILRKFGVDPETLGLEAANTEIHGSPSEEADATSADPGDAPDVDPIPVDVGVPIAGTLSNDPNPSLESAPETGGGARPTPAPLSVEGPLDDAAWLKQTARMLVSSTEPGGGFEHVGIIDRTAAAIKQNHTPKEIGRKAKDRATLIYRHCLAACLDNKTLDKDWVARTAGCEVADLRPEAR